MILTKDNLLRFVREKAYVTPTAVSETFDTTTMIASAALSELAKDKLLGITNLKTGTSPYYFDPKQKEKLIELGQKHFSNYDKEVFEKLKEQEVLNGNSLSIQEGLAIERLADFAKKLEIENNGKILLFWVWYLRDLGETRTQILSILKGNTPPPSKKEQTEPPKKEIIQEERKQASPAPSPSKQEEKENSSSTPSLASSDDSHESKVERKIEEYFSANYLKVESKKKEDKTIEYETTLKLPKFTLHFDCVYYMKRPNEADILKFYTSTPKPKIIFIENVPKKYLKLAENLDNLVVVNI